VIRANQEDPNPRFGDTYKKIKGINPWESQVFERNHPQESTPSWMGKNEKDRSGRPFPDLVLEVSTGYPASVFANRITPWERKVPNYTGKKGNGSLGNDLVFVG